MWYEAASLLSCWHSSTCLSCLHWLSCTQPISCCCACLNELPVLHPVFTFHVLSRVRHCVWLEAFPHRVCLHAVGCGNVLRSSVCDSTRGNVMKSLSVCLEFSIDSFQKVSCEGSHQQCRHSRHTSLLWQMPLKLKQLFMHTTMNN